MPIIECNRPSKLLIYTVIFLLALILESYTMGFIDNVNLYSAVIIAMFFNLCGILAIIPEIIINSCSSVIKDEVVTKDHERNEELVTRTSKVTPYDLSKAKGFWLLKNKKNLVIFLYLIVSLIDITTTIAFTYSSTLRVSNSVLSFSTEGLQIFISCLFCKIILKYKFELHKKVSLCIILIAMIVNFCLSFIKDVLPSGDEPASRNEPSAGDEPTGEDNSNIIKLVFITAYMVSFTAFQEVLEKYMMTNCFQSNYFILFVESVLGEIYAVIILLINYISDGGPYVYSPDKIWTIPWGYAILFSLACIPYSNMRLLIGRDFNPTDRIVADKVGNFYFFLLYLNLRKPIPYYIISIIGFMMIIFGSIVYNETIVLKFCNLHRDTAKEIEARKWREHESLMNDMNDLSQYNVTTSEMETEPGNKNYVDNEI